jgi:hypothetical protein
MFGGVWAIFDAFEGDSDSLTDKQQWQIGVALACIAIGALLEIFGGDD